MYIFNFDREPSTALDICCFLSLTITVFCTGLIQARQEGRVGRLVTPGPMTFRGPCHH